MCLGHSLRQMRRRSPHQFNFDFVSLPSNPSHCPSTATKTFAVIFDYTADVDVDVARASSTCQVWRIKVNKFLTSNLFFLKELLLISYLGFKDFHAILYLKGTITDIRVFHASKCLKPQAFHAVAMKQITVLGKTPPGSSC